MMVCGIGFKLRTVVNREVTSIDVGLSRKHIRNALQKLQTVQIENTFFLARISLESNGSSLIR